MKAANPTRWLAAGVAIVAAVSGAADGTCDASARHAVALHGGAFGGAAPDGEGLQYLERLADRIASELAAGASSLDSVERAVVGMEDSGLFNAGRGAIRNQAGAVETDAAIMSGNGVRAGAVASMIGLKNPIAAARLVMDRTPHVMLVGDRGRNHLVGLGAVEAPAAYFSNSVARSVAPSVAPSVAQRRYAPDSHHGTVGAVALDRCGDLAAATSTGGYQIKIPGRVGDVPVIGAGTYAVNGIAAVSATGHGEFFIRHVAASSVVSRMRLGGHTADAAARGVLAEMAAAGGDSHGRGGLIVVTADGQIAMPYTSSGMLRAAASTDQPAWSAALERVPEPQTKTAP